MVALASFSSSWLDGAHACCVGIDGDPFAGQARRGG
ncbi:Uncharacterised protein [Vibrio cholerae]|nr:Uncharacterised protein [Vibrio cholerae]